MDEPTIKKEVYRGSCSNGVGVASTISSLKFSTLDDASVAQLAMMEVQNYRLYTDDGMGKAGDPHPFGPLSLKLVSSYLSALG